MWCDMSDSSDIQEQFDDALERLLRRFRGRLDPSEAAERLFAKAEELTDSPQEAGVSYDERTGTLHVVFEQPRELEDRLSDFCDLGALIVDAPVPMHSDVVVRVSGNGRAVELMGRVVQELPQGRCVQIDSLDSITETRLRALPEEMRKPSVNTGMFDRPHTGMRAPFETPIPAQAPAPAAFERVPTLASHRPSVKPSRTWDLSQDDVVEPLLQLVANNATGMLELDDGRSRMLVLIDRGSFVDVASDPERPDESLESLLVRARTIDQDDAEKVTQYRQTYGVGSSEALLNLGICDWNELQIGLRTRIRFLLGKVVNVRGEARFFPLENLPSKPLAKPVSILTFAFGRVVETIDDDIPAELDAHLFKPPETLPPVLATVQLLPQHEDLLGVQFGAGKSANDLVRLARSSRSEALAAILTLCRLGFLDRTAFRPISRVQTQSVQQLDMLHARLATNSHFEIFGLHWSAYDEEIQKRYESLKKKFAPTAFGPGLDDQLRARIEEVTERVENAWAVLRNTKSRREHRAELVDSFQVESSVEMFVQQADTAVFRRDLVDAITFYSRVLELEPDRPGVREKIRQLKELT